MIVPMRVQTYAEAALVITCTWWAVRIVARLADGVRHILQSKTVLDDCALVAACIVVLGEFMLWKYRRSRR